MSGGDPPPKPPAAPRRRGVLGYALAFRRDLLSALPAHLYRACMAEFRSPLVHSVLCNDPALVRQVLAERPADFPKSERLREGLAPLLGCSVFVTNGAEWERQRRIIDPAFASGRLAETLPAVRDAAEVAAERLAQAAGREIDLEPETSHAAADVIFRTLFSMPIEDRTAAEVFAAFRAHQAAQPLVNLAALLPLPAWLPRWHGQRARRTARRIRALIGGLVAERAGEIAAGAAPDDLATRIMTTLDPASGRGFTPAETVDQAAIFFLAGHETAASALAWALWLLAAHPDWQDRVADEAAAHLPPGAVLELATVARLKLARAVFREAMRLYPPVPMLVRETIRPEEFRGRKLPPGTQVVISPWHLHRHERLWADPDGFDPTRWLVEAAANPPGAYIPFGAGARICPGAGFAMIEGPLMLARICRDLRLAPGVDRPMPVARLTVRGRDGIRVVLSRRCSLATGPRLPRPAAPPPASCLIGESLEILGIEASDEAADAVQRGTGQGGAGGRDVLAAQRLPRQPPILLHRREILCQRLVPQQPDPGRGVGILQIMPLGQQMRGEIGQRRARPFGQPHQHPRRQAESQRRQPRGRQAPRGPFAEEPLFRMPDHREDAEIPRNLATEDQPFDLRQRAMLMGPGKPAVLGIGKDPQRPPFGPAQTTQRQEIPFDRRARGLGNMDEDDAVLEVDHACEPSAESLSRG